MDVRRSKSKSARVQEIKNNWATYMVIIYDEAEKTNNMMKKLAR